LQREKKKNKIKSFCKIIALKNPWVQSIRTNREAMLLCEFYDARSKINPSEEDLKEAKKQNDRQL